MATTIQSLKIKSIEEIRDDYLRTYRNTLIARGVTNPDVSKGTEIYGRATSLAQQIYVASLNTPTAADAQMPDTSQGEDLERVARPYGLALRAAGPSSGDIVLAATVTSALAIATGEQLLAPDGGLYQVTAGAPYLDGDTIPIESLETGTKTNLAEGTVLRWVSPPPHVKTTALVGAGGLTGGVDAEEHEGLRARLLERLSTPANGSNWASVAAAAERSTPAVQKAFVYPACNGPSTCHVAVTRAPTATNKDRDVNATTLSSYVIPAVLASFPEFAEFAITTVENVPVDVSFGLALPSSPKASPAGPGGGWLDALPFPQSSGGASVVGSVTSSTVFSVSSDAAAPIAGDTIAWVSTNDWALRTAKIVSIAGSSPNWTITIDTPFVSANGVPIASDDWVFPAAHRTSVYVARALAAFAQLGPYEKTDVASLLPRAYRRPLASHAWTSELKKPFLRALSTAGDEVFDVQYLLQSAVTPSLPTSIGDPPQLFVPRQIAFYPV